MLIKYNANFWWLMVPVDRILSQDSLTWVKSTKIRQISQKTERKNEAKSYLLVCWSFCLQSFYLNVVPFSSVLSKDKVNSTWSHNCSAVHTPHFILQLANSFIFLPGKAEDHRVVKVSKDNAHWTWLMLNENRVIDDSASSWELGPRPWEVCLPAGTFSLMGQENNSS